MVAAVVHIEVPGGHIGSYHELSLALVRLKARGFHEDLSHGYVGGVQRRHLHALRTERHVDLRGQVLDVVQHLAEVGPLNRRALHGYG